MIPISILVQSETNIFPLMSKMKPLSGCVIFTDQNLHCSVEHGKKIESLEFGLSVMHMVTSRAKINSRESLVICMLKLLLDDLKILDMVAIMREYFYLTDNYDLCCK